MYIFASCANILCYFRLGLQIVLKIIMTACADLLLMGDFNTPNVDWKDFNASYTPHI